MKHVGEELDMAASVGGVWVHAFLVWARSLLVGLSVGLRNGRVGYGVLCLLVLGLLLGCSSQSSWAQNADKAADKVIGKATGKVRPSAKKTLRMAFVGDIMAHDSNFRMQDFSRIYQRVRSLLQQTELNFANLEFVINDAQPYSSYPRFNVHSEYVTAALDAGFNVFSLANNHSTDFGLAGVRATEQRSLQLQQEYPSITFSGLRRASASTVNTNGQAGFRMETIEHKGWKVGFTAISILTNGVKGIEAVQYIHASDGPRLEVFYDWLQKQQGQEGQDGQNYDLIVVSVHGGKEYQLQASPERRNIMRRIAQSGADIVWGHHPHVQQAWEVYQHDAGWSLVMHSQGNFISAQTIRTKPAEPQGFWAATGDAVLLQVQVALGADGQIELRELRPVLLSTIRLRPSDPASRGQARADAQGRKGVAFGVVPLQSAAQQIREQGYTAWDNFYAQRLELLQKRVAAWPQISSP